MAPKIPNPGVSEQGWLSDLKSIAEEIGTEELGFSIRWDVENISTTSKKRPDVIVYREDTVTPLASGEAKRPNTPEGEHPLVASEVDDAISKAQTIGVPVCFTTNFFEIAVWDSLSGGATRAERWIAQFDLLPTTLADAPNWWKNLSTDRRDELARIGLRSLFERIRVAHYGGGLVRDVNEVVLLALTKYTDRLIEILHSELIRERDTSGIPESLLQQGVAVGLDIKENAQARYLVAQAVAEVMTASLFYGNIRDYFSLEPIMGGTNPSSGPAFQKRIESSLRIAKKASGDYETIFDLTPLAQWLLARNSYAAVASWKALIEFIESIDFQAITSDVLGTIFERLISPERRHEMGQHYTQPRIAKAMVKWGVRENCDLVADISCGAGTFLVQAYLELQSRGRSHPEILDQVFGNDIDPFAVHLAAVNLATREIFKGQNYPAIRVGDSFSIRPGAAALEVHPLGGDPVVLAWPIDGFDVVLGNPPYAEKPADPATWVRDVHDIDRSVFPPGLTGGNQAAWFAVLAEALLRDPGGRWGLVLPVATLQNTNLAPWRAWLRTGRNVTIWHTEVDVWFSDARVATCVVVCEAAAGDSEGQTSFVSVSVPVSGEETTHVGNVPIPCDKSSARIVDLSELPLGEDLLIPGTVVPELQAFFEAAATRKLCELSGVKVASGNKLGHGCYQLKDDDPDSKGIVRSVTSNQISVKLNQKYLLPFLSSPKDERTGEFTSGPFWVLNAPKVLPKGGALAEYVRHCENLDVRSKPSVQPFLPSWWNRTWLSAQIAVQIHPGFLHQVWWSDTPFVAKNNFHVVACNSSVPGHHRELIAASLTSAYGALAALYVSSEVGCEGVRWLAKPQFEQWPVLDPTEVDDETMADVLAAYRAYRQHEATEIHTMPKAVLEDWRKLTEAVARAAGMKDPAEKSAKAIEQARTTCVRRTDRETLALAGRTRLGTNSSKSNLGRRVAAHLAGDESVTELMVLLTSGAVVVRLRGRAAAAQGSFDLGEVAPPIFDEGNLADILGVGFEAAPADSEEGALRLVDLATRARASTRSAMLPVTDAAKQSDGFKNMQEAVDELFKKWCQAEVRKRLN